MVFAAKSKIMGSKSMLPGDKDRTKLELGNETKNEAGMTNAKPYAVFMLRIIKKIAKKKKNEENSSNYLKNKIKREIIVKYY